VLKKVLECVFSPPDKERPTVGARWSAILRGAIARDPPIGTRRSVSLVMPCAPSCRSSESRTRVRRSIAFSPTRGFCAGVRAFACASPDRARAALQRKRDIQAAAADLNRAVAYRPDDADLLRQVNSLAAGQWRRQAMRRGLWAMGAVVVLAASSPLVARVLKRRPAPVAILPVPASGDLATSANAFPAVSLSLASSTGSVRPTPGPIVKIPPMRPLTLEPKERKVVITRCQRRPS